MAAVAGCARESVSKPSGTKGSKQEIHVDFEDGVIGKVFSGHIGAKTSPAYAQTGGYGCRLEPMRKNNNRAALVIDDKRFARNLPWASFTLSFRLVTLPRSSDKYMNLFEIGNTASKSPKSQFTVYFKYGKLVCDFNFSESVEIAAMPDVGIWHTISAVVGYRAPRYQASIRFDNHAPKKLVSKANKRAESVRALWIHYPTVPVDYTMDVDDIRMATSDSQPSFLPAP
ncbi:hypothetical protein GCM10027344_14090 [Spelaeicoccus albus]